MILFIKIGFMTAYKKAVILIFIQVDALFSLVVNVCDCCLCLKMSELLLRN